MQFLNQSINVAPPLLVCTHYDTVVNYKRSIRLQMFCESKVAENVDKRHVAQSTNVMLTQNEYRGDLFFFELFQCTAKGNYRLTAWSRVMEQVASQDYKPNPFFYRQIYSFMKSLVDILFALFKIKLRISKVEIRNMRD